MAHRKRRSDRAGRKALRSPGRPPVARRDELLVFWASIAAGRTSEAAAVRVRRFSGGRRPVVSEGWRDGAVAFIEKLEAAVRPLFVVCGA